MKASRARRFFWSWVMVGFLAVLMAGTGFAGYFNDVLDSEQATQPVGKTPTPVASFPNQVGSALKSQGPGLSTGVSAGPQTLQSTEAPPVAVMVQPLFQNGDTICLISQHEKFLSPREDGKPKGVVLGNAVWAKEGEQFKVFVLEGGKIALQAAEGNFVGVDTGDKNQVLVANQPSVTPNAIFEALPQPDGTVAFKTANGRYLSDQKTWVGAVDHNKEWEKFRVLKLPFFQGGKTIRLKTPDNKYVSGYHEDLTLKADVTSPGLWEQFDVVPVEASLTKVSFQTPDGKFVSSRQEKPNAPITGGIAKLAGWEKFEITLGVKNLLQIKANNGKTVSAKNAGNQLFANGDPNTSPGFIWEIAPDLPKLPAKPIYAAGNLRCVFLQDHEVVWCSKNQGPATVITVGRPKLPDNWVFFGDVIGSGEKAPQTPCLIVQDRPDVLKKPVDFRLVWTDNRAKPKAGSTRVSVWYPVPPPGYVSLGRVVTSPETPPQKVPAIDRLRCIRSDLVMTADWADEIWNSDQAGTTTGIKMFGVRPGAGRAWDTTVNGALPIPTGGFVAFAKESHTNFFVHGRDGGGSPFRDFGPPGTVLLGFEVRWNPWVYGIKAIFGDPNDPKAPKYYATYHGGGDGQSSTTIAKPGYAVGNIWPRRGDIIDALVVVYMKLEDGKLNNKIRYGDQDPSCRFDSGAGDGDWNFWKADKEDGDVITGIRGFSGAAIDAICLIEADAMPYMLKGLTPDQVREDVLREAQALGDQYKESKVRDEVNKALSEKLGNVSLTPAQAEDNAAKAQALQAQIDEAKKSAQTTASATTQPTVKTELIPPPEPKTAPKPALKPLSDFQNLAKKLKSATTTTTQLGSLPGFEAAPFLRTAVVGNASFAEGAQPYPWACLSGVATLTFPVTSAAIGGSVFVISRHTPEEGIRTALLFIVPTSDAKKIGLLGEVPLKYFFLTGCVLTYSTAQHVWNFPDLPAPVRDAFQKETLIKKGRIRIGEANGALFGADLQKAYGLREFLQILLSNVETTVFSVVFPKVAVDSTVVTAFFNTDFKSKVFPPGFAVKDAELEVRGATISLLGTLEVNLGSALHVGGLEMRIQLPPINAKPTDAGLTLSVTIPGEWRNPLGIKGLTIKELTISGEIGGPKGFSLGLKGVMDFGRRLEMAGAVSPTSPTAISAVSGKLDQLSLNDLIKMVNEIIRAAAAGAKLPDPGTADIPVDLFSMKDVEITLSEITNPALGLTKGMIVKGQMSVAGAELGAVNIRVITDKGFIAKAWVRKFQLGPLELTGAGPDGNFGTADDCPFLDLEYLADVGIKPVLEAHGFFSGKVKIGPVTLDALFTMNKADYSVALVGKLPGDVAIGLEGKGPIERGFTISSMGSLRLAGFLEAPFVGRLDESVMDKVKDTPVIKDIVGFISGSIFSMKGITLKGNLDQIASGKIPPIELGCRILGKDLTLEGPEIDLKQGLKLGEELGKKVTNTLYDQVVLKIRDLGIDIGAIFVDVGKKIGNFAEGTANGAKDAAIVAGKEIEKTAKAINREVENLGRTVAAEAAKIANEVARFFRKLWPF